MLVKNVMVELRCRLASHFGVKDDRMAIVRPTLYNHVHIENSGLPVTLSYHSGAIFISLVSLMIKRRPRTDTAIYGSIGPTSSFSSTRAWGTKEVTCCKEKGIRRVVVGKGTEIDKKAQRMADKVQPDGQPLLRIIHEEWAMKILQHCFD